MFRKSFKHVKQFIEFGLKYKKFTRNFNTQEYWNDKIKGIGDNWRIDHYIELVNLNIFPKKTTFSLIDIGCALGDGCNYFKKNYSLADISGCDFSEAGINKATEKYKDVTFYHLDINKKSLPQQYDFIAIIETLEHFDDPFSIIDKLIPYAKDSIIVSVPLADKKRMLKKAIGVGEHRYHFYKNTFEAYHHDIVKITDYIPDTESQCIIYRIYDITK